MGARPRPTGYTDGVTELPSSAAPARVAARRAGRADPGGAGGCRPAAASASDGFAATSVEDLARAARVTTGALYHHFPTKTALFETVFEALHLDLMVASGQAAAGAPDEIEYLARAFDAFLDALLQPDVQRILITDAPAVLGLARFTELDERYAADAIAEALRAAVAAGRLRADDPETLARLLLGVLVRGGMMIASSAEPARARADVGQAVRALLAGLAAAGGE